MMLSQLRNEVRELSTKRLDNLFRQIEALNSIYLDLRFKKSLPQTRAWAASPDFLYEIADHALSKKPQAIVECGSGVSTLILARSLQINGKGHLYSLEHLSWSAQKSQEALNKHGLGRYATIIEAPLQTVTLNGKDWAWYSINSLPDVEIDMLVIDGPPESTGELARYPAGPLLFNRLGKDGTVFLDDTIREDERKTVVLWTQEDPSLDYEFRDSEKGFTVLSRKR
jgi:predicted O-methyltransferase YrrM